MGEELQNLEFEDASDEFVREKIETFYKEHPEKTLKTLILRSYKGNDKDFIVVVIRGDLKVNLDKLKQKLEIDKVRFATKEEMEKLNLVMGYVSPIDCKEMKIIGDNSIKENVNYYDGGNKLFLYRKNVNYPRDFEVWKILDLSE